MTVTSRTSNTYLQKVRRFIRQHEMLLGKEHVLLAVSGGLDSMVLLDVMARLGPTFGLELAVAHFDHGLRGEASQEDAAFVVEQAKLRGLKSYVGRGDIKKLAQQQKLSIEEAARKARYQFFLRVARKHNYDMVLTAHNANDNAETLLLNLMRGSGVSGLAGIPPVRVLADKILIARPLIGSERKDLEVFAADAGVEWREDETNASKQFTRNRVRHELLPLLEEYNPGIVNTLNSTAEIMRSLEQYLTQTVESASKRVVLAQSAEHVELSLPHLKHYLPAIQSELIQRVISKTFDIPSISYGAVERTLALTWKETGSKAEIVSGINAVRDRDTLAIRSDPPPYIPFERAFEPGDMIQTDRYTLSTEIMDRNRVRFTRNSNVEYVDADKLTGSLMLRSWRDGDRFNPIGMEGEKKVSDFLIDQKVPLDSKRNIFVVADGENIVWVCGMRLDDRYKVDKATHRALKLELRAPQKNGNGGGRNPNG